MSHAGIGVPSSSASRSRLPAIIFYFLTVVFVLLIVRTYSNSIIDHFNDGGFLLDSGWFAFLFGSSDPWLHNPSSIGTESFYQHHISPIIFLWGALFSGLLGFDGIRSFEWFTVLGGLVIFLPYAILGHRSLRDGNLALVILILGALYSLTNEFVFRALGYPHYELVYVGLCGCLYALLIHRKIYISALVSVLIILTREDGGFYVAYVALCALCFTPRNILKIQSLPFYVFATAGVLSSATSVLIKVFLFPGFPTIESNFTGDNYAHLNAGLVGDRLLEWMMSAGTLPLMLVLPFVIYRYPRSIFPIALLTPLLTLHITALRDPIANFELHYSIPIAVLMNVLLIHICLNFPASERRNFDAALAFGFVILTCAPLGSVINLKRDSGYYFNEFLFGVGEPVVFRNHQRDIRILLGSDVSRVCGSRSVIALEPDLFSQHQLYSGDQNTQCAAVLLFERDLGRNGIVDDLQERGLALHTFRGDLQLYR